MHSLPGKRAVMVLLAVAAVLMLPLAANADLYGFNGITNESVTDTNIGETQLQLAVTSVSSTSVKFEFINAGLYASSICDVYFYDGNYIKKPPTSINGTGVAFSTGAKPPELPGYTDYIKTYPSLPTVSVYYSADSDPKKPGVMTNGVNPGDKLIFTFELKTGIDFADIIDAIDMRHLVVGIHVQGFPDGKSASFVNGPPGGGYWPAPVPPTVLLLGSGLVGLGLLGWRRRKQ